MTDLIKDIKFKSKPVAVVSSDWHLAFNTWKKHPDINGDAEYSLAQIVDISIELGVPLIAAGDLFDKKTTDSYSVVAASTQMSRMQAKRLPVYYVQGQHEMSHPTWMSLFPTCINVHNEFFKIGNFNLFGYDYFVPTSVEDSYSRFKEADILVTHQTWSELLPKHRSNLYCSYGLVASNIPYKAIISGDYHSHFVDKIHGSNCVFVSPGSTCLQDLSEPPNKAVWVMTENMEFVSVPIRSRVLINVTINSENDLFVSASLADKMVVGDLTNGIGKPILRIKYNTDIKNVYAAMNNAYKDKAYLDFKPIIEEEVTDNPVDYHPIKMATSSIGEIFCESLSTCFPKDHRGITDVGRLWSTTTLDELRKEIGAISGEIKDIDNPKPKE